jgi:hypothetical protein
MSKSLYSENAYLRLVFNGGTITGIAQNADSPQEDIVVALHTADPGAAGSQLTDEIVYTGYQRKLVPRTAEHWLVSGSNAIPIFDIVFGEMTGGAGGSVTHASAGDADGNILYSGPVTPNINVVNGIRPILTGLDWLASGQNSQITED